MKTIPEKNQSKQPVSLLRWLLMAAVFIVVIGSCLYFFIGNNKSATALAQKIVKEKAVSPFDDAIRGSSQAIDTAKWKTAFINSDFKTVTSILEMKENKSPEEQFFLALSYLKLSPPQSEKAEPIFIALTKQASHFTNDAWLYLGLTQTLLNQNEQAIISLQHVEQTTQVKELEERLRK